jgi:hypothetical protein
LLGLFLLLFITTSTAPLPPPQPSKQQQAAASSGGGGSPRLAMRFYLCDRHIDWTMLVLSQFSFQAPYRYI